MDGQLNVRRDKSMNLKQTLKLHKISQRGLAQAVGFSPAMINQLIKHGKYPSTISATDVQERINQALETLGATPANWQTTDNKNETELPKMQALTQQAKALFNLHKSPFVDDVQTRDDVYLSSEQRYIRQSMLSNVKNGGFDAIIGESGAGKTTLKRDLLEGIRQDKESIIVIQPQMIDKTRLNCAHLCDAIVDDVSLGNENPKRSMEAKSRQIKRLLTESSRAGNKHCLLIDEAHDLTIPVLKYLKRFWELEDGMTRLLSIMLIAQPELKIKLNNRNADIREVARRCIQTELQPLNAYVGEYLKHKFNRVGLAYDDLFAPNAMDGLTARLTQRNGNDTVSLLYPLIVNNAVISVMNACAELGQNQITADIFEGV